MNLALCYPSVLPVRGGCETYLACLARRLVADGHAVHLYACRWDADALPEGIHLHPIRLPRCPRFARAWLFSQACARQLKANHHDVSLGFDKIAGVDIYYPQGGEYPASVRLSHAKHRSPLVRSALRLLRGFDPTYRSLFALERRQLGQPGSLVLAISDLVRGHLLARGDVRPDSVRLLPIAAMPDRLDEDDRPGRRERIRRTWNISHADTLALFAGMNLRLKGLEPLLRALARIHDPRMVLVVAGAEPTSFFRLLAQELGVGDRVRFVGYCTDMRDAYFAADMLVHPTFYDPCANVVLEGLACGLPVITTTQNGASEQMRRLDSAGTCAEGYLLDDAHDDAALSRCIIALADLRRRQACAVAAKRAAGRWTFEDHYRALMEIIAEHAFPSERGSVVSGCSSAL